MGSLSEAVCVQALTGDRPHAAALKHTDCVICGTAVMVHLSELGSPVQYSASYQVDAKRCSLFFSFCFFNLREALQWVLQEEVSVLPGWGTWANQQKEPHWAKAANQKAQRSVKKELPSDYLGSSNS